MSTNKESLMISIDFNNEIVKAAPIAGAAAVDGTLRLFYGLTLNEWFYVAAILYTVAQTFALLWRTIKGKSKEETT